MKVDFFDYIKNNDYNDKVIDIRYAFSSYGKICYSFKYNAKISQHIYEGEYYVLVLNEFHRYINSLINEDKEIYTMKIAFEDFLYSKKVNGFIVSSFEYGKKFDIYAFDKFPIKELEELWKIINSKVLNVGKLK